MSAELFSLIIIAFLLIIQTGAHKDQFRGPAQCLNHLGEEVDWWFVYKENAGWRYLYYDSRMALEDIEMDRNATPMPLHDGYKINDTETSPIIKTILQSRPIDRSGGHRPIKDADNTLFVAINDQPSGREANDEMEALSRIMQELNLFKRDRLRTKDAFGSTIGPTSAHTKLFTAMQVDYCGEEEGEANLQMYIIQHSAPRFPFMPYYHEEGQQIRRRSLPSDGFRLFQPNLYTRAQHFLCISVRQQISMRQSEIVFDATSNPLIALFHTMKVIRAPVVGTNYDPRLPEMKVYRQIFGTDDKRTTFDNHSLFPLLSSTSHFKGESVSTETITSTARHYPLQLSIIGKSGYCAPVHLYDDLVAQLLIPQTNDIVKDQQYALVVQTQLDGSFINTNHRYVPPTIERPFETKISIVNSTGITLPIHSESENKKAFKHISSACNHSKIALATPTGSHGAFRHLVCFGDLNRTHSQSGGGGKNGRGGAAWCTSSSILSNLFHGLQMKTDDGLSPVHHEDAIELKETLKVNFLAEHGFLLRTLNDSQCAIYATIWKAKFAKTEAKGILSTFHRPVSLPTPDETICKLFHAQKAFQKQFFKIKNFAKNEKDAQSIKTEYYCRKWSKNPWNHLYEHTKFNRSSYPREVISSTKQCNRIRLVFPLIK